MSLKNLKKKKKLEQIMEYSYRSLYFDQIFKGYLKKIPSKGIGK